MTRSFQTVYQTNIINKFTSIYKEAITKVSDLETWPGYFLTKKTETELIFDSDIFKKNYIGLEIGCGNSFQSALLSSSVEKMISTDLYNYNCTTHTVGMNKAERLLNSLDISNVKLISCSADSLPFGSDYFDFIFSSSALEHVVDKKAVLREMRRVLKPDGNMVLIVPTHMPSLYAFPHLFLYVVARVLKLLFKSKTAEIDNRGNNLVTDGVKNDIDSGKKLSLWKRFFKNHPSFPFPEPHGEYKNIFYELKSQFPGVWLKLVAEEGFKVNRTMPLCLFPWLLIEPFSTKFASNIYSISKGFNMAVRDVSMLDYLGYLIAIYVQKESVN